MLAQDLVDPLAKVLPSVLSRWKIIYKMTNGKSCSVVKTKKCSKIASRVCQVLSHPKH